MATKSHRPEDILADLREGMGDIPVMEKYGISPNELSAIKQGSQFGRPARSDRVSPGQTKPGARQRRISRRNQPLYRVTIYDANNPHNNGIINDVTRKGIQVEGIRVRADETLTLLVRGEPFHAHAPFAFTVQCRWVQTNEQGVCVAGFYITDISPKDAKELHKLIDLLTIAETL